MTKPPASVDPRPPKISSSADLCQVYTPFPFMHGCNIVRKSGTVDLHGNTDGTSYTVSIKLNEWTGQ